MITIFDQARDGATAMQAQEAALVSAICHLCIMIAAIIPREGAPSIKDDSTTYDSHRPTQ